MAYAGGLYGGIGYLPFDMTAANAPAIDTVIFNSIISQNLVESVVSMFAFPSDFWGTGLTPSSGPVTRSKTIPRPVALDGYVPRNQKLLTFPYIALGVDVGSDAATYRYEWSVQGNHALSFNAVCGITPNPEIVIYPTSYNGSGVGGHNIPEKLTLSGFPQLAFPVDSYKAYLAQGAAENTAVSAGANILGAFSSGSPAGIAAGVLGAASNIANLVNHMNRGATLRGTQGSNSLVASRDLEIFFKKLSVQAQYARIIDDFFDRYGYATERIKTPNRHVRPKYTYTKTRDCAISGSVPADDMVKIKSIYNRGVTFWDASATVGDYSQANRPE